MKNNDSISLKRIQYNLTLGIRVSNKSEIEDLQRSLMSNFSIKKKVLLDEKIKYDHELKSELISIDTEINKLAGLDFDVNTKDKNKPWNFKE